MKSTKSLVLAEINAAEIRRAMELASRTQSYTYPWPNLRSDLAASARRSLACVGYGSLVNAESARRTLGGEARSLVIAFGVRRLFNLAMSESALNRYSPPAQAAARAALNAVPTGRPDDVVNGALFDVTLDDLPAFRAREEGYDLLPVACLHWTRRRDAPFVAWILSCPDEPRGGVVRTSQRIAPHAAYYRLCRDGAASRGDEFLRFWDETTFLADGATLAADSPEPR